MKPIRERTDDELVTHYVSSLDMRARYSGGYRADRQWVEDEIDELRKEIVRRNLVTVAWRRAVRLRVQPIGWRVFVAGAVLLLLAALFLSAGGA